MDERRRKIEELFHAASDFSSDGERKRFLDEACGADPSLCAEVEGLLKCAETGKSIFGRSEQAIVSLAPNFASEMPASGSMIGRYKILEQIAEGGMGVVYMAEQVAPVRRKVALKIIKLGMDTRQVVARFEAERQALAMMDHPHIAQVLDAGATETGRPYFVMELVHGIPITKFCDENKLSLEERLQLFIPVCQAIQSAHQKGIIHRDIKPSNVLVTRNSPGDIGHPMVIDFGVSKAIDQKLTEKTLFTNFATMIGTPAYMSPEQAEMSKLDVDTRSDIYSLGVLLYELLTGSPPFPEERLRSVAYGEMQRIIVEEEPERPSARLQKSSQTQAAVPNKKNAIDSDLDAVVLKALEKNRSRRYETASAFAADIQSYVRREPVQARAPSAAYRLQKWVARHKLQFSAAVIVIASLLAAVLISSVQAARAQNSEAKANAQTEAAEAVKQFLVDNLLGVNPLLATPDPDAAAYKATEALLEKTARSIEGRFTNQPLVEADIRKALFSGFTAVRNWPKAEIEAQRILKLYQNMPDLPRTNILGAFCNLAMSQASLGKSTEALKILEPVLDEGRKTPFAEFVQLTYAHVLLIANRPAEAVPHLREGIARRIEFLGEKHPWVKQDTGRLAQAIEQSGNLSEAESIWRQVRDACIRDHGIDHPLTLNPEFGLGRNLVRQGKADPALPMLNRFIEHTERTVGTNSYPLFDARFWLGLALEQKNRIPEGAELYRDLNPRVTLRIPFHSAIWVNERITEFFLRHHLFTDARTAMQPLQTWYENNPPDGDTETFEKYLRLTAAVKGWTAAALILAKQNSAAGPLSGILRKAWLFRYVGWEEEYRQMVREALQHEPRSGDEHIPIEIAALGEFQLSSDERAKFDYQMRDLERHLLTRNGDQLFWGRRALAQMQFRLGRYSEALSSLSSVEDRVEKDPYALCIKAACLHKIGNANDSRQIFAKASDLSREQLPQPLKESEPFLGIDQLYQHLLMLRETEALFAASQ